MKCDANCESGNDATVFFSYIEDGKVRKVNLCPTCANEKGVDDPTGYSLMDMLQGMGEETASRPSTVRADELVCESCGFTQSDFKKTGRFGCANCYQVFNEGLESLLEAMHKNTEHTGKVPSFAEEDQETMGFSPATPAPPVGELLHNLDLELDEIDEQSIAEDPSLAESPDVKVTLLQEKLDIAISSEDYEEAARIRDEIANLQKQFGNS